MLFMLISVKSFAIDKVGADNAEFNAYRFDNQNFIIMTFKDKDDVRLSNDAVLKLEITGGKVIRLQGTDGNKASKTNAVNWGAGIMTGSTSDVHYVIFPISAEQIALLKQGVTKIVINSVPELFQKSYKKDKLGAALSLQFESLKDEMDF